MSASGASGNSGRERGAERNRNQNVDRKNPGGYTARDLERMDRKNDGGYSARDLERMDRKNDGGYSKPSTTPKPVIKPVVKPKPVVIPKVITPTTAELSQSESADADEYDARKTKKKGRSMTILTSSKGLDDKYTLGKPSLLGS